MHFTRVDSDYVTRTDFDETTTARRFLSAALDQTHTKLLMDVATKMSVVSASTASTPRLWQINNLNFARSILPQETRAS